jgi:hypothetical protein
MAEKGDKKQYKSLLQIFIFFIVTLFFCKKKKERIHVSFPPKGGGLLRLSRAFSATLTGRFGMGTVRMGAEGRW